MPLPGGEADKLGNRYEGRWTVFCMIDVMDEKADSIRLEKPGEDAFEFFLHKDGKLNCHQVKRQRSGRGSWTLGALQSQQVQVLSDFWESLGSQDISCVFISTQDANELGELANRARDAASWVEFEQKFLNKTLSGHFYTLRQKWNNCSEVAAYEALKRVYIKTIGDDLLAEIVENRLVALVEGDPKTIRLELAELALERVHHELTAHDIWHYLLEDRGYRRREWNKDPHVLAAVDTANEIYLATLRDATIAGEVLPRDEVSNVLQRLTVPSEKRNVLLVGEAGVGKSGVTLQLLETLHEQGILFLSFRVDRLEPTVLPDIVGQQLGLPASPAIVLANIAQKRDCVLVIDQLDAVSLASGRNPQFFDCVAQIIKQAQAHSNIHLVLVCRGFDLENDNRLKRLTGQDGIAQTIAINRLASSTVKSVVVKLGLEVSRLSDKQIQLLSIPLHLSLLAEVAGDSNTDILNFETAKDLYDKFWTHKQQKLRERLGQSIQWMQVIDTLCNHMSHQQSLSIPELYVDACADDARAMASEHILVWEGKRISFFHEGFFDYAFARRFSALGQTLLTFLRSSEQHLFCRTQVRQILLHQRDADFNQYLTDLEELLTDSGIRSHLKQIVFALLGTLSSPQEDEWRIIAPLMTDLPATFAEKVWGILRSSVSWFQLVDRLGVIEQWLNGQQEELINKTLGLLSIMQGQLPDRVAELVEPFVDISDVWTQRLAYLLRFVKLAAGRRFFGLFLRLINTGVLDEIEGITDSDRDFWSLIYDLPEQNPDWACEAIGCYLNRRLNLSLARGQANPFDHDSGTILGNVYYQEAFNKSARLASKSFVVHILPFMLQVMELTARQEGKPPWLDPVWSSRTYGGGYGIDDGLLNCMETALSNLSANHPDDFSEVLERYLLDSKFETVQYLLIRSYTANGVRFADEAVDYLLQKPVRLKTGYSVCAGNSRNGSYWATRQLLEVITPNCSQERLESLEKLILDYYPDWERSADYRLLRGYAQFVLLDAIAPSRCSNIVKQRLQEWRRKFTAAQLLKPPGKIEPPTSVEARLIGPPIPQTAADRMTDKQWLQVIAQYQHDDAGSWFEKHGELLGGAHQIAQFLLEPQVKKEPLRFAQLIHSFPDDANISYFNAVLNGIAEVGVDAETALQVCQRCHQLPQHPCGRAICWLVQKLADLSWNQEAFDITIWYALNDPDPEQELWRTEAQSGQFYYGGDILTAGINSVRGNAATAIARLIFADKNRGTYFLTAIQEMVRDSSIAVRTCVAETLIAMLNYDRDLAVDLFLELCATEDMLCGTKTVEQFLYYALQTHFETLKPIIDRMLVSNLPKVVKVGARQACVASLGIEEAGSLASYCLSGTKAHRLAAAEIFVANLRSAHFREFYENTLIQLFNDSDAEVRSEATKCFFHFEEELEKYINLVNHFIQSPAFINNSHDLIWSLEKTSAKLPESIYLVCDRFVADLVDEHEGGKSILRDARSISLLLIRIYSQNDKNQSLQSQCLDLIDRMVEIGVYGLDQALEPYER
ncbi:MAG: hypothetical protein IGS54_04130 [Elainella sp. C42_A2020_010]|nr:hypothetical protein [Elainella sp. C42_A2020_010]